MNCVILQGSFSIESSIESNAQHFKTLPENIVLKKALNLNPYYRLILLSTWQSSNTPQDKDNVFCGWGFVLQALGWFLNILLPGLGNIFSIFRNQPTSSENRSSSSSYTRDTDIRHYCKQCLMSLKKGEKDLLYCSQAHLEDLLYSMLKNGCDRNHFATKSFFFPKEKI